LKLGHVAYRVLDLQKVVKFYCDVLGFRIRTTTCISSAGRHVIGQNVAFYIRLCRLLVIDRCRRHRTDGDFIRYVMA